MNFYSLFRDSGSGASAVFKKAITFLGTITASGNVVVTGNQTVGGTLGVTGNTTLTGTLGVTGLTTVAALTATGALTLKGITLSANAGSPEAAVTGNRKGDLCVDYTNGALYVFAGTATENTGWKLVTQAA